MSKYHPSWQWSQEDFISALESGEAIVKELEATATRRLELVRRAHTALMCYTVSHGTPMTDLIEELAKELEDE